MIWNRHGAKTQGYALARASQFMGYNSKLFNIDSLKNFPQKARSHTHQIVSIRKI
jgi:hypothetical protein